MKIVNNQMPSRSNSVGCLEVNSVHQPDNIIDVDQLKGDLKVFPEEFYNMVCHKKEADPLAVEINDYTPELPGEGYSVVMESQEVRFEDPLEMCLGKIKTDLNNHKSSADVSCMEVEHLVSRECFRETDGSVLRDILVEDIADSYKCMIKDSKAAKDIKYGLANVKVDVEWPMPVGLKSMAHEESKRDLNGCDSKVLVHQTKTQSESSYLVSSDPDKELVDTFVSEDTCAEVLQSNASLENRWDDNPYIQHKDSKGKFWDVTDKASSSAPEDAFKETADDGPLLPVNNNEIELPSNVFHPQMADASKMHEQQTVASDHLPSLACIERDYLESSFASVGPHTNSIAYSGSVAYSGSLSHRSDVSNVSTRSFAFPVLQNEWNFSPVRMRKASRRHLGRRRGWMNGLFCCRF